MREVKIHIYCDVCFHQTRDRVEGATSPPIDIPGYKPKTLDMCERHEKELLNPLRELLTEYGTKPSVDDLTRPKRLQLRRDYQDPKPVTTRSASALKRWTCPLCSAEMNRGTAIPHLYRLHTASGERPAQPEQCPECEFTAVGKPPVVMAKHRGVQHDWDALSDALKTAGGAV